MNTDLVLMFGALILLAVSGLLVFCFTESKGKNTPHARGRASTSKELQQGVKTAEHGSDQHSIISH